MEQQYNNTDFFKTIFEFYESNELFDMNDMSLKEYRKLLSEVSKDLYEFIESNFSDEARNNLKSLLYKKNDITYDTIHRENILYYKNGFINGINFILQSFE